MKINKKYIENNFIKIINDKLNTNIVFKDKFITVIKDIKPVAPVHLLIITNKIIKTINDIKYQDKKLIGHCFIIAIKIAKMFKIHNSGYRLISNCNNDANQKIFHFHIHIIGGKNLGNIL